MDRHAPKVLPCTRTTSWKTVLFLAALVVASTLAAFQSESRARSAESELKSIRAHSPREIRPAALAKTAPARERTETVHLIAPSDDQCRRESLTPDVMERVEGFAQSQLREYEKYLSLTDDERRRLLARAYELQLLAQLNLPETEYGRRIDALETEEKILGEEKFDAYNRAIEEEGNAITELENARTEALLARVLKLNPEQLADLRATWRSPDRDAEAQLSFLAEKGNLSDEELAALRPQVTDLFLDDFDYDSLVDSYADTLPPEARGELGALSPGKLRLHALRERLKDRLPEAKREAILKALDYQLKYTY